MSSYVVTITGASGSVYGLRLVEQLLTAGHTVTLIATKAGRDVMAYETGFVLPAAADGASEAVLRFLELPPSVPLRVASPDDLFDAAASGSARIDAMVVCPASMGFCGSVAAGLGADLPERAADVMLKEKRPLVIVPRETPLSLVHLRNLTTLAEAGAAIVPAMPAFYHRPGSLDDLVNFVVGKVLDQLGVEHRLFRRWGE
ncbi:MAG: flavin prenyltransferase UbiX [Coriobacteriia bacterium]|nr:flavin prenyltransferase UbiX [Coriobacteriia bacterium]